MTLANRWLKLKMANPTLYAELDKAHRKKNKNKIRQRARDWNRDNKTRRNLARRIRYAETKADKGKA